jgi:hypothetical protein
MEKIMRDIAIAGRMINEMIQATSAPRKMQSTRSINIPHIYLSKYRHSWELCDTEQKVGGLVHSMVLIWVLKCYCCSGQHLANTFSPSYSSLLQEEGKQCS